VSAVVVLPLLLLAASTPALAVQCKMAGLVLARCCCPVVDKAAAAPEAPPSPGTIGRESCCRLQALNTGPAPTAVAPQIAREDVPVAIAIVVATLPVFAAPAHAFARERFAVPVGPPILQVKQAFLI
jgi:hypothetical protein